MRAAVKQDQHTCDDPYVCVREHPVPQRPRSLCIDLPPHRIRHHRRDSNEADYAGDPAHVEKADDTLAQSVMLKPEDRRAGRHDWQEYSQNVNQALRPVGLVNVAAVSMRLIHKQQAFDLTYLCEIFSGLYASKRPGWTVLFATVRARLGARRIHCRAVAAEVAFDRDEVLGRISWRRNRIGFDPQKILEL